MKISAQWILTVVLTASLGFLGFQCGSPEFTGAKVYINQKNYPEAIRLLEIETQKNPANDEAWFLLGRLRADRGEYVAMNVAFNEALKLSDKHLKEIEMLRYNGWANHINVGVSALQKASSDSIHLYDMAIDEFTKARDSWPDTSVTYVYMGYAFAGKGDEEAALRSYQMGWEKGKEKDARKQMGRIYLDRGKKAKREFETANADKIRAMQNLKDVDKGMSIGDLERLLGAPDTKKPGPRGSGKEELTYTKYHLIVNIEKGRVASKKQTSQYMPDIDSTQHKSALADLGRAIEYFEDVKTLDPTDNSNLQSLLDAYVQSDRIAEAIRGFRQAIENEPGNKWNHYVMGVLNRQIGNFEDAIEAFGHAIEIDETYTDAEFDLGATYYNWGVEMLKANQEMGKDSDEYKEKFRLALPHLERVAEVRTNDAAVWETMGTIYARLGQADKAMNALNRADEIRKGN